MSSAPQPKGTRPPPRDELADQRERRVHGHLAQLPRQRRPERLDEPEREQYERQLDAYEVQLAGYRAQLAQYAAQLDAAHHDGLTGAWLRAAGRQLLEQELQRAGRAHTPLSIAFVDVDGLKTRNDTRGHAAGDHALRVVARALLSTLRSYDHVIRWGGDEFLCVLPGLPAPDAAARLAHVQERLARDPEELSVSVGVAQWVRGEDADALVDRADRTLYRSRNRTLV